MSRNPFTRCSLHGRVRMWKTQTCLCMIVLLILLSTQLCGSFTWENLIEWTVSFMEKKKLSSVLSNFILIFLLHSAFCNEGKISQNHCRLNKMCDNVCKRIHRSTHKCGMVVVFLVLITKKCAMNEEKSQFCEKKRWWRTIKTKNST